MTATFLGLIVLSALVALRSGLGHRAPRAEEFFVASGRFGSGLFFFLAVGETYSVATILGFPGGVYARGTGFVAWFLGYILLSFPVGYFLNPWIWRAGRLYGAVTLADLFRRHFDSRMLELVVTTASILFLVPLGVLQFVGLDTVLRGLGWDVPPLLLVGIGAGLAFAAVLSSGIRAPAQVAVLKDLLVLAAVLSTGIAALELMHGQGGVRAGSGRHPATGASWSSDLFTTSTILLQSVGFCLVPQTCAALFTARSVAAMRRAQMVMPLYMLMFPFLLAVADFALDHRLALSSPNDVFPAVTRLLLPGWMVGVAMAAAALSALVVLAGICLTLGPLVSRNLLPGLDGDGQRRWSKLVMALYLLLSVAGAARSSQLMVAINNLFYFGVTQSLPGLLAILLLARAQPAAIAVGLIAGDGVAILLHEAAIPTGGINPGFVGLLVNGSLMLAGSALWPGPARVPVMRRWVRPASQG